MPPRVTGRGSGGFAVQLRRQRANRAQLVALLDRMANVEDADQREELTQRLEALLAKGDRTIRELEHEILLRRAPLLHLQGVRLDREITTCRLALAATTRPRRGRTGRRSRRVRTDRRARSPGRSTDDDPLDPPADELAEGRS